LDQSLDSIFNNFNSTTRNEIRRVEKDSTILFKTSNDLNLFYGFYNKFAKSKKNLSQFNGIYLLNKNDIMIVTIAAFQFNKEEPDEPMVMHLYLIDYEEKRAVLLNSASLFRYKEFSHLKNKIGMANRFLHFRDMLYFRSLGLSKYDFGGYAINTNDTEKKQINFFKQSFGGEIITEYDYSSFLFFLAKQIQKLLKYVKLSFLN
jgi:lipid II:glycine glycyltransferase (peptidoglycan interpeptide bridge formation enzyme)